MIKSIMFLCSLSGLLLLTGFFLIGFLKTRSLKNLDFVVNVVLFCLLLFEFGREVMVAYTGIAPVPSVFRLRLIQVEYTLLGLFLREVIYHVDRGKSISC